MAAYSACLRSVLMVKINPTKYKASIPASTSGLISKKRNRHNSLKIEKERERRERERERERETERGRDRKEEERRIKIHTLIVDLFMSPSLPKSPGSMVLTCGAFTLPTRTANSVK